jgi:hypothetical protein
LALLKPVWLDKEWDKYGFFTGNRPAFSFAGLLDGEIDWRAIKMMVCN